MDKVVVFFVDDEVEILKLIELYLKRDSQFECHFFSSAKEALEKIKEGLVPSVVITDINMPQVDGFGLVKEIASSFGEIKLGYCSAFSNIKQAFDSVDVEYDEDLKRPFYIKPIKKDIIDFIKKEILD